MTALLQWLSQVLGVTISLGTLLCVTLPGLRRHLGAWLTGREETAHQLQEICRLLEKQAADFDLQKEEINKQLELQRQVDLCVLRDLITTTYYQYVQEKRIPVYALEDVVALNELYQKRGGNSYVQSLMHQILEEWEILS